MTVIPRDATRPEQLASGSPFTRTVPFDYVVTLPLGEPGESTQSLVNISTVGPFVVTSIGYSLLIDQKERPELFGAIPADPVDSVLNTQRPALTPEPVAPVPVAKSAAKSGRGRPRKSPATLSASVRLRGAPGALLQVTVNGEPLKGGAVELDENGRAQRELPELPSLATVVLTDINNGRSSLPIVLVRAGAPSATIDVTPQFGALQPQVGSASFEVFATPGSELEVTVTDDGGLSTRFQHSETVPGLDDPDAGIEAGLLRIDLTGPEQAKTPTFEPGDIVLVRDTSSQLSAVHQVPINPLDISLRSLPASALKHGFRVHAGVLESLDNETLPKAEAARRPFVPCGSDPGELSFLYSIIDNGTGRALQSEPIHNIAGLGIADGDRPFRAFPRPFVLDPRSVLLFQVRALSGGPGTLYFVLQGYKVVGGSRLRLPGSE